MVVHQSRSGAYRTEISGGTNRGQVRLETVGGDMRYDRGPQSVRAGMEIDNVVIRGVDIPFNEVLVLVFKIMVASLILYTIPLVLMAIFLVFITAAING